MAISRHGINRGDSGPLLSASFEETVEVLFKSAIFARKDDVDGVTPNIMLGAIGARRHGRFGLTVRFRPVGTRRGIGSPGPAAERFPEGVGRRVARRGSRPGAGDDALRVVSGRLVRGFSRARRRDAGLGRRGVFSYCWWHIFRPIAGARRVADLRGVAGVWRRGVAGVRRWGCESGLFVRSGVRDSRHVYRSYVLTVMRAAGRVPHRSYPSQAYITRLQCRPGVWNQPTTSGRFPDCSYPSQVLQAPRTRGVTASGRSLVALLTVPFPPRPTSPAYSPTSPACALRCRKPLFFAVCTCRRFESHVLFHTDSPTCVFPCPRALYDAMASPEASRRTAEAAAHAAFRPLDPTLIAQCFPPIGRRPVACSAIDLRLALREGRPISRARLLFFSRNTCRFADFASGGLQRPQTTFPSC